MNSRHHHELCKFPRITHISEDFFLSARLTGDYEEDSEDEYFGQTNFDIALKASKERAKEVDAVLDMYNVVQSNSHRINLAYMDRQNFNGIVVSISKGKPIIFVIDNQMTCSERVGVEITFPEGLSRDDFIGSAITNVRWGREKRDEEIDYCFSEIIIETTIGNLTLTAFNQHNGYYSHAVIACFNDEVEQFSL